MAAAAAQLAQDHQPLRGGALAALVQQFDEVGGGGGSAGHRAALSSKGHLILTQLL